MTIFARRKPFVWPAFGLTAFLFASPLQAGPDSTPIDPSRTHIKFLVDAIGWPRTKGSFNSFSGKIFVDLKRPEASSIVFRVAAQSIDVGSPSFDDYLRGDAFFDVARYPDITFVSNHVEKLDDRHARVSGDLTLRGVTAVFRRRCRGRGNGERTQSPTLPRDGHAPSPRIRHECRLSGDQQRCRFDHLDRSGSRCDMSASERWPFSVRLLHWVGAAAILFMLALGFVMVNASEDPGRKFDLYQAHKSGSGLLGPHLLIAVRIALRLARSAPAPLAMVPVWRRRAAASAHIVLYALTIALILAGYATVSASPLPLPVALPFGLEAPNLLRAEFRCLSERFKRIHHVLAALLALCIAFHIAATLTHRFFDRDGTLRRMSLF